MPRKHGRSESFNSLSESTKKRLHARLLRQAKSGPQIAPVVNGMPEYLATQKRTSISVGIAALTNNQVIPAPVYGQKTNNRSNIFLNAIGISVENSERGFTLLSNPEKAENTGNSIITTSTSGQFNNPNILDNEEFDFLQNENISMESSFLNQNDPFYQLDNSRTITHLRQHQQKLRRSQQPELLNIGSMMTLVNVRGNAPMLKLKYFNNDAARIALRRSKF